MSQYNVYRKRQVFTHIKSRNFAGSVMAFVTAVVMIPGMTIYLPFALVDKIALPILCFPFVWLAFFLYSYLAKNVWHPWLLMITLLLLHIALIYLTLMGVV